MKKNINYKILCIKCEQLAKYKLIWQDKNIYCKIYNMWKDMIEKVDNYCLKWLQKVMYPQNYKITKYFSFERTNSYVNIWFCLKLAHKERNQWEF